MKGRVACNFSIPKFMLRSMAPFIGPRCYTTMKKEGLHGLPRKLGPTRSINCVSPRGLCTKRGNDTLIHNCRQCGAGLRILPNTRNLKYPRGIEGFIKYQVCTHVRLEPNPLATEVSCPTSNRYKLILEYVCQRSALPLPVRLPADT